MERTKYTDEVLDERMQAIDKEFNRLFTETQELRREMRAGFSEVRADLAAFRHQMMWAVGFLAVSLISLLSVAVLQQ